MKKLCFIPLAILLLGSLGCKKTDSDCSCTDPAPCDQMAQVNDALFTNGPDDDHFIREASVEGDCLYLRFQYGGGCGTIDYQLVANSEIVNVLPPQRGVRLALEDNDSCEALLSEIVTFNLKPLRINRTDTVRLSLEGWEENLLYTY